MIDPLRALTTKLGASDRPQLVALTHETSSAAPRLNRSSGPRPGMTCHVRGFGGFGGLGRTTQSVGAGSALPSRVTSGGIGWSSGPGHGLGGTGVGLGCGGVG